MDKKNNITANLITDFWLNFPKKDFNYKSYYLQKLFRENINIDVLKEKKIDFQILYFSIYEPTVKFQLPTYSLFYNKNETHNYILKKDFKELETEIFKSGKYLKTLKEVSGFFKSKLEWLPNEVNIKVYLELYEYTNFGNSYMHELDLQKLRYGTGFTEIDFLKNEIKSAKATIRNLENGTSLKKYDLIDLFNIRIYRFNKKIGEITNQKPIRLDSIVNAFDYSDISSNIFNEKRDTLKSIEDRLIEDGYFNSELEYKTEKGKKTKLVALIHILFKLKIIKSNVAIINHRKFFEERYKVEIYKQMQPNQFDTTKIKNYKADFIFISNLVDNYTSIF